MGDDGAGARSSEVTSAIGTRLFVDPDDIRGAALLRAGGRLNPGTHVMWQRVLDARAWDLVLDVGANYGEMVATYDLGAAQEVVAVEPNPRVLTWLRRTLAGLPWSVRLVEAAVADEPSRGSAFALAWDWSGVSTLRRHHVEGANEHRYMFTTVPVTTVDEVLAGSTHRTACIKIDVEGAEMDVLSGAGHTLASLESVAVLVEILHLPATAVVELAGRFPLLLLERGTDLLVRLGEAEVRDLAGTLASGRYAVQDAVLVSGTGADRLLNILAAPR